MITADEMVEKKIAAVAASAYLACSKRDKAVNLMKTKSEGMTDEVARLLWEAIDAYEDRREVAESLKFQGLYKAETPKDLHL